MTERRESGNPEKPAAGIGMPHALHLQEFAIIVSAAFDGAIPYQVGSSMWAPKWRDVDVRIMLDREKYEQMGFGDPKRPHDNPKWCALVMAFSELGRKMTDLPIDFQIQEVATANEDYPDRKANVRSALVQGFRRRDA